MKIAVFVSGRGSNLQAIIQSDELNNIVEVCAVISDKTSCGAFDIAKNYSIPYFSVSNTEKTGFLNFTEITKKLKELNIDLVVLAGFLKLIPVEFVKEFEDRIINIHPALLPSFGGSGMYGMNVHRAVFASSVKVSGPTVHFVNEKYDAGMIIAQRCTDINDAKNPEEIAERVLKLEHKILPYVIKKIAEGKVLIQNNRVTVAE